MYRIGIAEDDPELRAELVGLLRRYEREHGVALDLQVYADGADLVEEYRPDFDVLFLDIEMDRMDGITAAHRIRAVDPEVVIVFVTQASHHAIRGYEVAAFNYLVKPIRYYSFSADVGRALDRARERADRDLLLTANGTLHRVDVADVVYIESMRHRIHVHTRYGVISFTGTLKSLEAQLEGKGFHRSNHGYLVNLRHVVTVDAETCAMSTGQDLKVSRARRRGLLDALADHIGARTS